MGLFEGGIKNEGWKQLCGRGICAFSGCVSLFCSSRLSSFCGWFLLWSRGSRLTQLDGRDGSSYDSGLNIENGSLPIMWMIGSALLLYALGIEQLRNWNGGRGTSTELSRLEWSLPLQRSLSHFLLCFSSRHRFWEVF